MNNVKTLLIEDDASAVELYRVILAQSDLTGTHYDVMSVPTIQKARAVLLKDTMGLVLLDLKLPNGSGLALVREVRALAPAPFSTVVVITGLGDDEIEREAFDLLVDDFIRKTREGADEILRICRKALARSKAHRDLLASTPDKGIERAEEALRRLGQSASHGS